MGTKLSKSGGLTSSMREWADAINMTHNDYKQIIIQRIEEMKTDPPKPERLKTQDVIVAKNPVLIIANGSSFRKNFENYKRFDIPKIVVDVSASELIRNGTIPDYIITLESSLSKDLFNLDQLKPHKDKITVIGSSITRPDIITHITSTGIKFKLFSFDEEPRCSNVGIFAINYAKRELKADKILLVGFEHMGTKYPDYTYRLWQTDFWYFVKKWPKETIVNCTDGGALYYRDYVIDTNLGRLKIE